MAIIECPECGKKVSDKANICIGCGFPISEYLQKKKEEEKRLKEEKEKEKRLKEEKENIEKKMELISDKRMVSINSKNRIIEIKEDKLSVKFPRGMSIKDYLCNFTLEYFSVSMGMNVGLCINNVSKGYTSGIVDITCTGTLKKQLILFKDIMNNNGLFKNRSRFNVLYRKTKDDKEIENKKKEIFHKIMGADTYNGIYKYTYGKKEKVYCPRCGSENCSHYQEQIIIPGKTKTRYTANLNPLKPLTLVNKKEKVIRKESVETESKFLCNSCGKIFK